MPAQVCELEGLLHDLDEEMSYYGLSINGLVNKGELGVWPRGVAPASGGWPRLASSDHASMGSLP
jgi:hypothetical protein